MQILPPIVVLTIAHVELRVSLVIAIVALTAGAAHLYAGKTLQRHQSCFWIGAIGMPFGLVLFTLLKGWSGTAGYFIAVGLAQAFIAIPVATTVYNSIERSGLGWKHTYHYFIGNEITLNIGRISSFVMVLALASNHSSQSARDVLLISAVGPLVLGVLQVVANKALRSEAYTVLGTRQ